MEAFTRLQQKDLYKTGEDNQLYAKPRNRDDKYQKTNPKQVPKPHKVAQAQAKRNSLTKATTSLSLVPINPIYENLDPEKLKNFSLPRIRQLWCTDPNCTYNSNVWIDQNGIRRSSPSMSHHLHRDCSGNGGNDNYGVRTHQSKRHDDGNGPPVGYYEEEVEDNRRGGKLKIRPDISPAASNSASYSTESTGLSSRNKRSEGEMSDNSASGQLHSGIPNTDFHQSFKSSTNSRGSRPSNGPPSIPSIYAQTGNYPQTPSNPFCPSCNGVIPLSHLETIPEMSSFKAENGLWNFNNFHYPLQRDSSIGGFTLNGQPRPAKKSKMAKFCSSHKIALVVSTFSLLVTIGLIITLLLMKKKGMMEPM